MSTDCESPQATCTLAAADYPARIAWIEELNETALTGYRRDGNHIRLRYHPAAAAMAQEFVVVNSSAARPCTSLQKKRRRVRRNNRCTGQLGTAGDALFAAFTATAPTR